MDVKLDVVDLRTGRHRDMPRSVDVNFPTSFALACTRIEAQITGSVWPTGSRQILKARDDKADYRDEVKILSLFWETGVPDHNGIVSLTCCHGSVQRVRLAKVSNSLHIEKAVWAHWTIC